MPTALGRDGLWQGHVACAQHRSPAEETYINITQKCWEYFVDLMRNVTAAELCEWKVISRYRAEGALPGITAGVQAGPGDRDPVTL